MTTRPDWPLGPALKRRREAAGLSVKAAARRTRKSRHGKVSDGRWYQLESGYQIVSGQQIPIGTTPGTVAAAAEAVGWDIDDALRTAGFDPEDYHLAIEDKEPDERTIEDQLVEIKDLAEGLARHIDNLLERRAPLDVRTRERGTTRPKQGPRPDAPPL